MSVSRPSLLPTRIVSARAEKGRCFGRGGGSATETAAALEILRLRRLAEPRLLLDARRLTIRVVRMLSRLTDTPR